jgi:hypothetical protein
VIGSTKRVSLQRACRLAQLRVPLASTLGAGPSRALAPLLFCGLLAACGGADPVPVDEPASLQAVLSIERMEDAAHASTSSASAMAQFVVLPADANADETLDAAGLRSQLPERRGCSEVAGDPSARTAAGSQVLTEQLELLEAGEVSIQADGTLTRLALNLFPSSGSASGVIYTTPDQSAPLPPDARYAIRATGSYAIPPLDIQQDAPGALRDVTVGGVPLERATSVSLGQPLDITWAEGEASDRVFVELTGPDAAVVCNFADEDGSGSVPSALTAKLGSDALRVAVHRVRESVRSQEPPRAEALILETMVRFDFELTSTLRVD